MKRILLLAIVLIIVKSLEAQNVSGYQLFAHYPFLSNASDATGNNSDSTITNTTFSSNGIYSNGLYSGNSANGTVIQSPNFSDFPANDYIITFDFKPDLQDQHIIRFGGIWGQWLTISTDQGGKLFAVVRVSQTDIETFNSTNSVIQANTWYNLGITYKNTTNTFTLFINGNQIVTFTPIGNPYYDNDYTFRNENGSIAETYKGYYKNIKIYKNPSASVSDNLLNTISISPNPCSDSFKIINHKKVKKVSIYNIIGKTVYHINNNFEQINISDFQKGIYLVKIITSTNQIFVKKLIVN